jgi:hypothetical protein
VRGRKRAQVNPSGRKGAQGSASGRKPCEGARTLKGRKGTQSNPISILDSLGDPRDFLHKNKKTFGWY